MLFLEEGKIPVYYRHGVTSLYVGNAQGRPILVVSNSSDNGLMSPPDIMLKNACTRLLKDYIGGEISLHELLKTFEFEHIKTELELTGAIFNCNGKLSLNVGFEEEQ
jgi:hypothetical protein